MVGYLALAMGVVDAVDGLPGNSDEPILSLPTYLSFLSVMMTAVAAYTIREITERANKTVETAALNATKAAEKAASVALSEEAINDRIDKIALGRRQTPTVAELEESFDKEDDGNR